MRQLLRRLWYLLRQRRFEAELSEEMEFHRHLIEREVESSGADAPNARLSASRQFGSVALAHDQVRDVWMSRWLRDLGQDLQYALRTMVKNPVFAGLGILCLALGIGVNSTIFSMVDTIAIRPLPFHAPEELVVLRTTHKANGIDD